MKQEETQRKGCSKPTVVFFIIAVLIVAAFLIVGLVKTCDSDRQEGEQVENVLPE